MGASYFKARWLIYAFLCTVADTWDMMASSLNLGQDKQPEMMSKPSDIDTLTDDQVLELMETAPALLAGPNVPYRSSAGTVAKFCLATRCNDTSDCPEANAHDILFLRTTIPVPRVRRVIKDDAAEFEGHVIFMDYIKGPTLAEVWSTYSLWQKIKVALTLRRYVRQLRGVTASETTPPGPASRRVPLACDVASIFGKLRSVRGPFASYDELSDFMNKRYEVYFRKRPQDSSRKDEKFDNSSPLILTHNDLNPRNIIVGEDGHLWVLDWAWSGFYPRWFEFCAMTEQVQNEKWLGWRDGFWELMIPFVCGPYFRQQRWLNRAGYGLYYR